MPDWKDYLASIYFDPKHPASFTGPDKLYKTVLSEGKLKIGKRRISKWLRDQESYSLTKEAKRTFKRSRVIVEGIDSMWDIDLMDMTSLIPKMMALNTYWSQLMFSPGTSGAFRSKPRGALR